MRVGTGAFAGVLILVALLFAAGGALAGDAAASSAVRSVVLKKGDRGPAVRKLQRSLHVSLADGVFGRVTLRAVKRFQRRHGLTADGVAGATTQKALGIRALGSAAVETASGGSEAGSGAAEADGGSSEASTVSLPRVLRRIAECESGGDPTAVSPDGRYRGKYQFTRATWRALGGKGDPADAAEATQDRVALKLYRRSGTDPWPTCSKS